MKDLTLETIQPRKCVKHYKGGEYWIMQITYDENTGERRVIYQPNTGLRKSWDRPLKQFLDRVQWPDGVERTRYVLLEGD